MDTQTPTDSDREAAREWATGFTWDDSVARRFAEEHYAMGLAAARPTWTGTPPAEPGFYWWRSKQTPRPRVCEVEADLSVWWIGYGDSDEVADVSKPGAEWSPIPTPAEPTT